MEFSADRFVSPLHILLGHCFYFIHYSSPMKKGGLSDDNLLVCTKVA